MKKLYCFLALMLMALGIQAQSWLGSEVNWGAYNHETVVYARLTSNLPISPYLTIGAFIDGTCRAYAQPDDTAGWLFTLRVKGDKDADLNNAIFFKVYDPETGFEYMLEDTGTFDGETHGQPSTPVEFTLTAPESFSLTIDEMEVGEELWLPSCLTVTPANARLPLNTKWRVSLPGDPYADVSEYATLNVDTLTALAPCNGIFVEMIDTLDIVKASWKFDIVQHATAINLLQTSVKVYCNEPGPLQDFMTKGVSYELVPGTASDVVLWEVDPTADATVLQQTGESYLPVKAGTTRIRPYIIKKDQSKLTPTGWITVTCVVPVDAIVIDLSLFNGSFVANLGDTHLYERMQRVIRVLPEEATDKTYSIDIESGDVLTKVGATSFTASAAGTGSVRVTANGARDNMEVSMPIVIDVEDPVVAANVVQNTIYVVIPEGNPADISDEVRGNVQLQTASGLLNMGMPVGDVAVSGTSVSYDSAVLDAGGIQGTFTAQSEGTTTFTVTLRWNDYDSWGVTSETLQTNSTQVQFSVVVTAETTLMGFDVSYTNAVAGKTGLLTFTPQPQGATFDVNDIAVSITNGLADAWGAQLTATKQSATTSQIVYQITSAIPGLVQVAVTKAGMPVTLNDPTATMPNSFTGYEIGYDLSLDAGWQWRSNPCGVITPAQFGEIFTDNLVEIRTANNLLYNDPSWGFYGTLNNTIGLKQGQCYKLKMQAAQESVLYGSSVTDMTFIDGSPTAEGAVTITLQPGWNWVGSPYLFDRLLSNVFTAEAKAQLDGASIVGKEAFAVLDHGVWEGSLNKLTAGQGYIIKNPKTTSVTITLPAESLMTPGNEGAAGVKGVVTGGSVWEYDHARFMNNMTIVAELADVSNPEHYSIGAFVGDECRGEGIVMNGKAFITVHCNAGEYVTFKLYDNYSCEYMSVDEGMEAQTSVGSLQAPCRLHARSLVDGIASMSQASSGTEAVYDLGGRRMVNNSKPLRGVAIRRMADGSMRKVIVK